MDFYIKNKRCILDKNTLPDEKTLVGDNTDYTARFIFDEEWNGLMKTARFVGCNDKYADAVLTEDDTCEIPLAILKSGVVRVGVFAGNLAASTGAMLSIAPSILDRLGLPADPPPDVYTQLMDMIVEIRDKAVSDEEVQEAVKAYFQENGTSVASPAKIGEVTLTASGWKGSASPYSQVVNIEGVTKNSQVDLTPNVQQLATFYEKDLTFVTENDGGKVTVYAIGQKPTNDYTIQVTITEVEV